MKGKGSFCIGNSLFSIFTNVLCSGEIIPALLSSVNTTQEVVVYRPQDRISSWYYSQMSMVAFVGKRGKTP